MTDENRPLLALGGSGLLGEALRKAAPARMLATYASRPFQGGVRWRAGQDDLDDVLGSLPRAPAAVLVLFGQTSIDACFRHPDSTRLLNVEGVRKISERFADSDIPVVFVSSDAVFGGSRGWWRDDEVPMPILEYGRQKREAELAVMTSCARNVIVRLPKLVSGTLHPQCFVSGWYRDLQSGKRIQCATDQRFNPVSADDAAYVILELLARRASGVVHVAADVAITRWDLLQHFLASLGSPADGSDVQPCHLSTLPLPEPRPLDTSLLPSAVLASLSHVIRPPDQVVSDLARNILAQRSSLTQRT